MFNYSVNMENKTYLENKELIHLPTVKNLEPWKIY